MWEPLARAGSVHDTDSEAGIEEQEMERRERQKKREEVAMRPLLKVASLMIYTKCLLLQLLRCTCSISIMSLIEDATQVQTHTHSAHVCVSVCVCV